LGALKAADQARPFSPELISAARQPVIGSLKGDYFGHWARH
jgi:hypothetical protein